MMKLSREELERIAVLVTEGLDGEYVLRVGAGGVFIVCRKVGEELHEVALVDADEGELAELVVLLLNASLAVVLGLTVMIGDAKGIVAQVVKVDGALVVDPEGGDGGMVN